MKKIKLKVIQGGLDKTASKENYKFTSAYVTNTRLMGVLVVYINWENNFHQFFYFDVEEFGLDTYKSFKSNDTDLIQEAENSLIGGLGGEKISISKKEAIYLVKKFIAHNLTNGISLPGAIEECDFFLDEDVDLNKKQVQDLTSKLCVKIKTPYETINYFLMRLCGKDYDGAKLVSENVNIEDCIDIKSPCTLLKNTIDIDMDCLNKKELEKFECTSLIDNNISYQVIVSEITVSNLKVINFELISTLDITAIEASMMLAQDEFIDLFKTKEHLPASILLDTPFTSKAMKTKHDRGITYMIFNPTNSHVSSSVYRLSGDVLGVYYVSYSGQLIISANTIQNIKALENDLKSWKQLDKLLPTEKYQFDKPVLAEFLKSNLDDFEEFIEIIGKKE